MAFQIHRWDAVQFGSSTVPVPVAYILPSDELLTFAARTQGTIQVILSGTSFPYGGRQMEAALASSMDVPNCRPHFFNKTQLYVLVLNSEWYGYPDVLGTCTVVGLRPTEGKETTPSRGSSTIATQRAHSKDGMQQARSADARSARHGLSTVGVVVVLVAVILLFLLSIFLNHNA